MTGRRLSVLVVVGVLIGSGPARGAGEVEGQHRLVVVAPSETDARVGYLREAVAFWNRTLDELGLGVEVVEAELRVAPPETDALENYTRQLWQQAGRLRPGMPSPAAPEELGQLGGDVVIFLSAQPTMSFAWPLEGAARHFVAVPREPGGRLQRAGSTRNVIAHELGHTLGLVHQRDPVVLMCGPCRPNLGTHDDAGFLPLTEVDRRRLRTIFTAAP